MRIWCIPKQHISFAKLQKILCKINKLFCLAKNNFVCQFLNWILFLVERLTGYDGSEGRRHLPSGMKLQWFTAHESCLALQKSSSFEQQLKPHELCFTWVFTFAVCDEVLRVILLHVRFWHPDPPSSTIHSVWKSQEKSHIGEFLKTWS